MAPLLILKPKFLPDAESNERNCFAPKITIFLARKMAPRLPKEELREAALPRRASWPYPAITRHRVAKKCIGSILWHFPQNPLHYTHHSRLIIETSWHPRRYAAAPRMLTIICVFSCKIWEAYPIFVIPMCGVMTWFHFNNSNHRFVPQAANFSFLRDP